jgi:undecaprenyl-diphosphatase
MVIDNQSLFLFINSYAGKNNFLDAIAVVLGNYLPFIFIGIEVYLYFVIKKREEALYAFYSMLLALLINQIIALVYFHNRPFMDGIGKVITYHFSDNSFPSDHTSFMLAIAWSLFLSKSTKKLGLILISMGIVGASFRIFIGVHYPFDILGGISVGLLSSIIILTIKEKLIPINQYIFKLI